MKAWTGFKPQSDAKPSETSDSAFARREIFRAVAQVLWRFRRRTALALLLLVTAKMMAILVPVALKHIVDDLAPSDDLLVLPVFLLIAYALLRFLAGLFTELRDLVFVRVTQTAVADFTVRMFDHLHSMSVRFLGARQTGVFSRDVSRGTAGVGFLMGTALFTLLPTLVEIASVVLIMAFAYRAGFAGIVMVTFVVYAVFTVVFTERRTLYQRQLNELDSEANGQLVDSLMNYETVKFYTSEHRESLRLRDVMKKWVGVGVTSQQALSILHLGQSGIIAFGVAAVMLLAGQEVVSGRMAVGDLILVNAYVIQVCLPLNTLGLIFRQAREALINAERMSELLRVQPESDPKENLPDLQFQGGSVAFSDVDFAYEPGRKILHQVDFRIEPGQTVAVVGGSGSGKSTLARLLLRFYDVDSGSVSIDGQDLRTVNHKSIRDIVGVVPQDAMLFNNTIAYNIAYGAKGATLSQVIEAAKAARIHELIESLPAQYDTLVGERGVKVSGGERQRIAIARAILKNPPLLVFDEATSALDTRTERAIQSELDQLAHGRSTLIIAHRLSTIVDADTILVMDQGRVVERGTHSELLRLAGLYSQMWNLQRQQSEMDEAGNRVTSQPVNLVTLVAGVLDAMRPSIDEKELAVYSLIGSDPARVTGDPSVLQDIICRVFDSAIAATPLGGRVELRVEREGQYACVSVTDGRHAPLLSEADVIDPLPDHVLRPLDPLQMGALLEPMGGSFHSEPAPDGDGHRFSVKLPLRAVASLMPAATAVTAAAAQKNALEGLTVFVVDDQDEARELIAGVLEDHGAKTAAFSTGNDLLQRLQDPAQAWPDLLFCDIAIGEPDGFKVISEIRRMEAQRRSALSQRLPAVALSGFSGPEDRLRALLAGFQVYVTKPVDPRELIATTLAVAKRPARP